MFKKIVPLAIIIVVVGLVFRNFFFRGMLPIPGDLLIGAYYPWLDYNWGFSTGVPVKNPLPSDIISMLYPWRILGMEILKSGHFPLWDSTILLGTPLLANFQAALLNPFNILFLFLPSPFAWSIQVVLQPILIFITTFLFLRNLGLHRIAAIFGGISFAFSGFAIVWMEYNTIDFALAYFPLALLLIDKIIQKGKTYYIFLLGLVIAIQSFSGYPQICIYTAIFSIIYFVFRLNYRHSQIFLKSLLFIIGISSGIAFAAVQLLPSLELLQLSIREIDKTAVNAGVQFLPLTHLITLFIPDFFGNPVTANHWLGSFDNFAFSLPAVTVFFALLALTTKVIFRKENVIFIIFVVVSLGLAINNPFSQAVSNSSFLGLKSAVAARVLFVFDFALAVFAAFSLNELIIKKEFKRLPIFIALFIIFTVFSLAIGILKLTDWSHGSVAIRNSILPISMIILSVSALIIVRIWKLYVVIMLGILLFNITFSTDKYLSFIPPNLFYPQTEAIRDLRINLQGHRFDREKGEIFTSNTWVPFGLKSASGQNAIYPLSVSKYLSLVNGYYPNLLFRFVDVTGIESSLYDTLDIKYLTVLKRKNGIGPDISGEPMPQFITSKFKEYKEIGTVKILENSSNLGVAWFSKNTICVSAEQETARVLKDPSFNSHNMTVVNCSENNLSENLGIGRADILVEIPNYRKFETKTPQGNYLTISQALYPGWDAFIDGQKVQLFSANLALMSVFVPQGEHILELKYNPQSFTNGVKISLFSLLGWSILLLGSWIYRRYNKK